MHVLLNWLVQGTAVTVIVALGVRAHGTMTAATRERIWWVTVIGLTLMPVAFLLADLDAASRASLPAAAARLDPLMTVRVPWSRWALAMLVIWAAWTIVHLVRVGLALVRLQRTKQSTGPFPRDREARLAMWTRMRDSGRPARLVASTDVYCAAVLGLHHPLIAVAPDATDRLTDEELDQIVLHEYAHIQRRDDLAIVAQRIISAVAGLHPAVWWLDRALTIDREVACDDWVVTYAGARTGYARCLVELASSARSRRRSLAPGALCSRSQLSIRVAALLDSRRRVGLVPSRATFLVASPAVLALVVACVWMPLAGVARERPLQIFAAVTIFPRGAMGAVVAAGFAVSEVPVPVTLPRLGNVQPRGLRGPERSSPPPLQEDVPSAPTLQLPTEDLSAAVDPLPAISLSHLDFRVEPAGPPGETVAVPPRDAPWKAAAEAGLAIGSGSRHAALKTAAAFSRLAKSFTNPN
jgi:beta-lactamase regulating signal transducer with metallopeptidase domain